MSKCGRTAQLESMLSASPSAAVTAELEAHATHCAPCAHELRWLRSEEALFSQRRTRQQVRTLMKVAQPAAPPRRAWSTVALALAASALLLLGVSFRDSTPQPRSHELGGIEMSQELASLGNAAPECSVPEPGQGFACEPLVLASFR